MAGVTLSVVLGLSLVRMHHYQKYVSHLFSNKALMISHWAIFTAAAVLTGVSNILDQIATAQKKKTGERSDVLRNVSDFNFVIVTMCWKYVQACMLLVFIRYGRPL